AACVFAATTSERFRRDLVASPMSGYLALVDDAAPGLVDRLASASLPERLQRFPGRPGHVRRPWGPGWALVGDAGYYKDPITPHGLTDALRDAELLAIAITSGEDEAVALARYEATRDRLSEG